MYIIVGLGNPGKQYENTKHNVGFLTIDILAEKLGIRVSKIKHKALIGEGFIGTEKVILAKPQTYMNLSGESVREILSFYKTDTEKLIVIYDDIDLPMGSLRIRKKGSAGTHNGMRSIIYQISSEDFPRVRVGIGGEHKGSLADYVISGFRGDDKKTMEEAIVRAADSVVCAVERGIDIAMGEYNSKAKKKSASKKKEIEGENPPGGGKAAERKQSEGKRSEEERLTDGRTPEEEMLSGGGKAEEGSPSDGGSFKEKGLSNGGNTEEVG